MASSRIATPDDAAGGFEAVDNRMRVLASDVRLVTHLVPAAGHGRPAERPHGRRAQRGPY